jgi:two-component system cell cycle sensor histidine kinase/response regulator CckA
MKDENRTNQRLTAQLADMRQRLAEARRRIAELEASETEYGWAEEALQESTELFRQIAENTKDVFWVINLANFQVVYINPAYEETWGRTRESLCAAPDSRFDAIHPEDRGRVRAAFDRQIQEGKDYDEEYRIVWPDGAIRWVHDRGFQIRNELGEIYRIGGITTDITERKQAEEERERLLAQIQEQARRVQQIVDTVPEGVLLVDAGGQVVLTNPVGEEHLAVLAGAGVGHILTYLGDRPLVELLASPPEGLWHEVVLGDRSFEVIANPTKVGARETSPTPSGWVLVVRDVTREREVEQRIQQQERLAAAGQFAAGIAHDFNNILATIILYAQMIARTKGMPDRARERIAAINQQAQHATNLIRQILDFGRRSVLERQPLDLLPLLKEQVTLLERTLPENIHMVLDHTVSEHTAPFTVNADPTRIRQVITNLVVNARDAMPEGGELRVGLERIVVTPDESPPLPEMAAGEWVQVMVSDTGTGIPAEVLPHIFEPFFTTKAPLLGTGLGLAQVHGIVGQHEGHIDVKTLVGEGTTVTMYLPALSMHSLETTSVEQPDLVLGKGETILVVEDNAAVREALVSSLEQLNYRTLEATDGQEALTMWEQRGGDIALVLSDMSMPGMGGIALLRALRERGLSVPVIVTTGHSLKAEMEQLLTQGMVDWLPKPFRPEQLARVVARALHQATE